jgi:uncharacterized protein YprB with RNaseH-like and TPR domain
MSGAFGHGASGASPPRARILVFDIEATALNASFGHLLCVGYKYFGQAKVRVPTIRDFPAKRGEKKDAGLCREIHRLVTDEADILVSWYGKEYDRKFLNTRMLKAGLPPMPPLSGEHIDLFYTSRGSFKFHSNRLQGVSETLGCPYSKTPVRADVWESAMDGDAKALAYVVKHCRLDVLILEWVYDKLRAYVRQHPAVVAKPVACHVCGGEKWKSNGLRYRQGSMQRRYQCQGCGAWTYRRAA